MGFFPVHGSDVNLSGHALYDECVQTKTSGDNNWMPLLKIGEFLENNNARQIGSSAKKVCAVTNSDLKVSCVNHNNNYSLLLAFSHSCFAAALSEVCPFSLIAPSKFEITS